MCQVLGSRCVQYTCDECVVCGEGVVTCGRCGHCNKLNSLHMQVW